MQTRIHSSKPELGRSAAIEGAESIAAAIADKGEANIVLATGASQFETLAGLVAADIDWSRVTAFHLDEYVGLDAMHPASFRRYLKERFLDHVGALRQFVAVNGDAPDLPAEIARLNDLMAARAIDVCFGGVGENCHLAFNDPPADFETDDPYIVVDLDAACRAQQLGEGWFPDLDAVPGRAVSMSIRQIMRSRHIILSIPDARKADAVQHALEGPVDPLYPASIVQQHPRVSVHLDAPAAQRLSRSMA